VDQLADRIRKLDETDVAAAIRAFSGRFVLFTLAGVGNISARMDGSKDSGREGERC
jgi:hypothetical protein